LQGRKRQVYSSILRCAHQQALVSGRVWRDPPAHHVLARGQKYI
jgi:hypothetical protein